MRGRTGASSPWSDFLLTHTGIRGGQQLVRGQPVCLLAWHPAGRWATVVAVSGHLLGARMPVCLSVRSQSVHCSASPGVTADNSKCSQNLKWVQFSFCPRALQKEKPQTLAKSARHPTAWPPPRGVVLWWRNTWCSCHPTDWSVTAFPDVGAPAQHDRDTVPVGARAHRCRRKTCKAGKGHPHPKIQAARGSHTVLQAQAHPQGTWRCLPEHKGM